MSEVCVHCRRSRLCIFQVSCFGEKSGRDSLRSGTSEQVCIMRAMLLAAGYGTRLRPLTNSIPKCLVPINGKPLLQIWLERLTAADIGPFVINTHHLAEQVRAFIAASPYRNEVTLVHEPELCGTAGTLIANLGF